MAVCLHDRITDKPTPIRGEATPITGWALTILARLDRDGARGLIADLSVAGVLTRQAAFVALANLNLNAPGDFLKRLAVTIGGAKGIGVALRTRRARQIIAAAFAV